MTSTASPRQTLSTDLMACLDQEDMTDIHLLGSDGVKVPAFRIILACRSNVFHKMLLGNFEESSSNVIKLDYNSGALRALVEFCITDNVRHFDGCDDATAARGIVQLIACAHFLNMPLLQDKAQTLANILMMGKKSLACTIYDEALCFGDPTETVKLIALSTVRSFPEDSLLSKPGILFVRPAALKEFMRDDNMQCEEITLFRALKLWALEVHEDESLGSSQQERKTIAKDLAAAHIRFSSICPTDLLGIAKESCLVDEKMIFEALGKHALLAEKKSNIQFSQRRKAKPGITVSGGQELKLRMDHLKQNFPLQYAELELMLMQQ